MIHIFDQLWLSSLVFVATGVVVWLAGVRLTVYADSIASRTGLGHALIGALLLGGITSLPELATTTTAAFSGEAALAVNNVLGGVAMQVAILALADALIGERGLSTLVGTSSILVQGNGLMVALALAAAGITSGSIVLFGIDLWTAGLFAVVVVALASIHRYEKHPLWQPVQSGLGRSPVDTESRRSEDPRPEMSMQKLITSTVVAGMVVVVAGFMVTRSAETIAESTPLGASFVGALLLAGVTSLPEVSTTFKAVRLGHHRLAFSNIFGTNLLDVGFIFVADMLFTDGAVLDEVDDFAVFAAVLGILLTGIYVAGTLQRPKRVVLRMGVDSALVLAVYVAGVAVMYGLR